MRLKTVHYLFILLVYLKWFIALHKSDYSLLGLIFISKQ